MSGKNRNRLESPLGVWTNPVYKTSWASLAAKQAVTVGSSSGLTWSCYMIGAVLSFQSVCQKNSFAWCLHYVCLSLRHARIQANKLHYGSANQEIADASVRRNEQKGVLIAPSPSPSPRWPLYPAATKFHVVPPTKNVSFCFFSLAVAPFLLELHWPVALLSLFLCLSLSLYSKFVDMTINLSLILKTTRIQKHFPLSVFVFIHSLVVASQHAGGHTLSRQKKLTFG